MKVDKTVGYTPNSRDLKHKPDFKARLYINNIVTPYLQRQAGNISTKSGMDYAQKWLNGVVANINKLGPIMKNLLKSDTPLVLSVNEDAFRSVVYNNEIYTGLDGELVLDGKSFVAPTEYVSAIDYYRRPMRFKFGPSWDLNELVKKVSNIPSYIAELFNPF